MATIPGRPKKGRRFGGDAAHQKAMMGNLVASLIAGEGLVTTEAKAKALRPVFEKCLTKAKKGGVEHQRQVVAFIRDKDMAHKLFVDIAPRYADRSGGYTRILKLGPGTETTRRWPASSSFSSGPPAAGPKSPGPRWPGTRPPEAKSPEAKSPEAKSPDAKSPGARLSARSRAAGSDCWLLIWVRRSTALPFRARYPPWPGLWGKRWGACCATPSS